MTALEIAQQGFVPPAGLCIATQGFICEDGPEPPVIPTEEPRGGGKSKKRRLHPRYIYEDDEPKKVVIPRKKYQPKNNKKTPEATGLLYSHVFKPVEPVRLELKGVPVTNADHIAYQAFIDDDDEDFLLLQ